MRQTVQVIKWLQIQIGLRDTRLENVIVWSLGLIFQKNNDLPVFSPQKTTHSIN